MEVLKYADTQDADQEAVLVADDDTVDGPCRLLVGVCQDVLLEGQDAEGAPRRGLMGVYQRSRGLEVNGRGVWQQQGGQQFLFYSHSRKWYVGSRESMKTGHSRGLMKCKSAAINPDEIDGVWQLYDGAGTWVDAPNVQSRVCGSIEKHRRAYQIKFEEKRALAEAKQHAQRLVVEGLGEAHQQRSCMGIYELLDGEKNDKRWQAAVVVHDAQRRCIDRAQ